MHDICLRGELDLACKHELDELLQAFDRSEATSATVDLEQVTFLDSTGLGFLAALKRSCVERDGSVTLLLPGPSVDRVLRIVSFDRMFEILGR